MSLPTNLVESLQREPRTWLITGVGGFIGSNLLETLLKLDQQVVGFDNFSSGHRRNLTEVQEIVPAAQWARFTLIDGDIRDAALCRRACDGADYVLHHAALGSVPLSVERPQEADAINVAGTLNILTAARDAGVKRMVYASSSAVYGDLGSGSMVEDRIGRSLSPYAVTKQVNELYAEVFARCYGFGSIGLRYFNVFGPRQDPNGAYAAVIPKWINSFIEGAPIQINGDGETTRDFCHIDNVVLANLLAATTEKAEAVNKIYNIACGERSSLNQLFATMRDLLASRDPMLAKRQPEFREFRPGDVRHSQADITRARTWLGYAPGVSLAQGLEAALSWYLKHAA